jgi:hypothetical protein
VGNSIIPRLKNATPNKQWHERISSFDFPCGKPTDSALKTPDARWQTPDGIAEVDGYIYVLKNGTLDRIAPKSWTHKTCPTKWPGARAMTAGGKGARRLYIAGKAGLYELDPATWRHKHRPADWSGAEFMAAAGGYVHVLSNGLLHRITPRTLESGKSSADWSGARWMCHWGDRLYIFKDGSHYRVDPVTLKSTLLSDR